MSRISKRLTIVLALALLAGPALAGCSAQGIVDSATGGKVTLPAKSVPADFPTEVPLAKGTIVVGAAIGDGKGGKIWNVEIADNSATIGAISAEMAAAGFIENVANAATAEGGAGTFSNSTYTVIVLVAKGDAGKVTVNYTVAATDKK